MKLSYIFIGEYRNINKQGFNLDGEYLFEFIEETGILKYKKNDKYIPNYYSTNNKQRETSISATAVIGENGSGKSALEYVCGLFRVGDAFKATYSIRKDLLIFRETASISVYYKSRGTIYSLSNEGEINLNEFSGKPIAEFKPLEGIFSKHLGFYYSTSNHDRVIQLNIREHELVNVSNVKLYYESHIPVVVDRVADVIYPRLKSPSLFKYEDVEKQLMFLNDNLNSEFVPFEFQHYGYFSISFNQSLTTKNTFKNVFNLFEKKFALRDDIEYCKLMIVTGLVVGLVYPTDFKPNAEQTSEAYEVLLLNSISENDNLSDAVNSFLMNHPYRHRGKIFQMMKGGSEHLFDYYRIPEKIEFLNYVEQKFIANNFLKAGDSALNNLRQYRDLEQRFFNPFELEMRIEEGGDFCRYYKNTLEDLTFGFIEFDMGLSSGEVAILNLFSRLYFGYKSYSAAVTKRSYLGVGIYEISDDILIMIDEAESYLHPEWQKKYFRLFVGFLEKIFPAKNVQLIITSHSPFIASDFPRYDIVFLERKNGKCSVSKSENHKETLGANIHMLFKDAFYMKTGFMGEFITQKVQKIIDTLNQTNQSFYTEDENEELYIRTLLDNLGEPVLRDKLLELFNERIERNDKN